MLSSVANLQRDNFYAMDYRIAGVLYRFRRFYSDFELARFVEFGSFENEVNLSWRILVSNERVSFLFFVSSRRG